MCSWSPFIEKPRTNRTTPYGRQLSTLWSPSWSQLRMDSRIGGTSKPATIVLVQYFRLPTPLLISIDSHLYPDTILAPLLFPDRLKSLSHLAFIILNLHQISGKSLERKSNSQRKLHISSLYHLQSSLYNKVGHATAVTQSHVRRVFSCGHSKTKCIPRLQAEEVEINHLCSAGQNNSPYIVRRGRSMNIREWRRFTYSATISGHWQNSFLEAFDIPHGLYYNDSRIEANNNNPRRLWSWETPMNARMTIQQNAFGKIEKSKSKQWSFARRHESQVAYIVKIVHRNTWDECQATREYTVSCNCIRKLIELFSEGVLTSRTIYTTTISESKQTTILGYFGQLCQAWILKQSHISNICGPEWIWSTPVLPSTERTCRNRNAEAQAMGFCPRTQQPSCIFNQYCSRVSYKTGCKHQLL